LFAVVDAGKDLFGLPAAGDRHAGVGLLPAEGDVIARLGESRRREFLVHDLGLLHAEEIRLLARQPADHLVDADAHRVDVERGDLHVGIPFVARDTLIGGGPSRLILTRI
jgi:hypothetical protein